MARRRDRLKETCGRRCLIFSVVCIVGHAVYGFELMDGFYLALRGLRTKEMGIRKSE